MRIPWGFREGVAQCLAVCNDSSCKPVDRKAGKARISASLLKIPPREQFLHCAICDRAKCKSALLPKIEALEKFNESRTMSRVGHGKSRVCHGSKPQKQSMLTRVVTVSRLQTPMCHPLSSVCHQP